MRAACRTPTARPRTDSRRSRCWEWWGTNYPLTFRPKQKVSAKVRDAAVKGEPRARTELPWALRALRRTQPRVELTPIPAVRANAQLIEQRASVHPFRILPHEITSP